MTDQKQLKERQGRGEKPWEYDRFSPGPVVLQLCRLFRHFLVQHVQPRPSVSPLFSTSCVRPYSFSRRCCMEIKRQCGGTWHDGCRPHHHQAAVERPSCRRVYRFIPRRPVVVVVVFVVPIHGLGLLSYRSRRQSLRPLDSLPAGRVPRPPARGFSGCSSLQSRRIGDRA